MSITVHIDGQPALQLAAYRKVLDVLGPVPNESQRTCAIWTHAPQGPPHAASVWLNPAEGFVQDAWLKAGGAILISSTANGYSEDRLREPSREAAIRGPAPAQLDPAVLAGFLAHDFPLIDALMLARAFRGHGWPNTLSDYPVPVGSPKSNAPFAEFPRNAGLYAVVPTSDWVHRLARANVPVVQLRDKRKDDAQRAISIGEAMDAVAGTATLLFVNDDWQLAIQHSAYGVHLGQEDLDKADLASIHGAGLRLGISTHGIYEMLRAHACRPSYMALGAIYATPTKVMPTSPQGLRRLEHYVRLMSPHYPLVAIGGIDLSRMAHVWATGVDCVAVLRAIVDADDYRRATAELLDTKPYTNFATGAA